MPKFYQSKLFKRLNEEWRMKLQLAGFKDHEDTRGDLKKEYDRRTIAWDNIRRIQTFYLALGSFLSSTKRLPKRHRQILSLYSTGLSTYQVSAKVGLKKSQTISIIAGYKKKILETL
jgi:hypothetical protein